MACGTNGGNLEVAAAGVAAEVNNFPSSESPDHAIDGVGQKYLNFAEVNTGFMVSPTFNGGNGSVVTALQIWTANDVVPRDPASFELYGTLEDLNAGGMALSQFSLIAAGPLNLPGARNAGASATLNDDNSETITFANTTTYKNYLLLFPTVKNSLGANSMQIAEAQFFGDVGIVSNVPDTGATLPAIAATFGALLVCRRAFRG